MNNCPSLGYKNIFDQNKASNREARLQSVENRMEGEKEEFEEIKNALLEQKEINAEMSNSIDEQKKIFEKFEEDEVKVLSSIQSHSEKFRLGFVLHKIVGYFFCLTEVENLKSRR